MAVTTKKTKGHELKAFNTQCTGTSTNAGNKVSHLRRLRRGLYKDSRAEV